MTVKEAKMLHSFRNHSFKAKLVIKMIYSKHTFREIEAGFDFNKKFITSIFAIILQTFR